MSIDAITLLRSIDATLKQLLAQTKAHTPKEIASDADLDGQYGDPIVKVKDPRDWTGPSMKGRRFSECPSEYLEMVASRLDFFAESAERENKIASNGKPEAPYRRRDAARARGWAQRVRNGWKSTRPATTANASAPATEGWADHGEPDDNFESGDVNWG